MSHLLSFTQPRDKAAGCGRKSWRNRKTRGDGHPARLPLRCSRFALNIPDMHSQPRVPRHSLFSGGSQWLWPTATCQEDFRESKGLSHRNFSPANSHKHSSALSPSVSGAGVSYTHHYQRGLSVIAVATFCYCHDRSADILSENARK